MLILKNSKNLDSSRNPLCLITHYILLEQYFSVDFTWWFDRKNLHEILHSLILKKIVKTGIKKIYLYDLTEFLLRVLFSKEWKPSNPSSIYSWSIQPLSVLHSGLKCECVTLESMICRSVTRLNLVTCIFLFWETDYNQPF